MDRISCCSVVLCASSFNMMKNDGPELCKAWQGFFDRVFLGNARHRVSAVRMSHESLFFLLLCDVLCHCDRAKSKK